MIRTKIQLIALLLSIVYGEISNKSNDIYTIQQAQQCFHSKSLLFCEDKINQCLMNNDCKQQMFFYQDCNFKKQSNNQIFNGNCFKNWKNTAIATKSVIDCLDDRCNLASYNSHVSLTILNTCITELLIQENLDCNQQCQEILETHIKKQIQHQPIKSIYDKAEKTTKEINQNAHKIIKFIQKQCIDEEGSIRKRQEQQILTKMLAKRKLTETVKQKQNKQSSQANLEL